MYDVGFLTESQAMHKPCSKTTLRPWKGMPPASTTKGEQNGKKSSRKN